MIEKVLQSVKDAEVKADQIKTEAEAKARQIVLEGQIESANLIKQTKTNVKANRQSKLEIAKVQANKNFEEQLNSTEQECKVLKENMRLKANELAEEVFRRVIDGNC